MPPSNSPPVFPSSLYCPGCFAPTEHAPSANATSPAPHEPAGGKEWECGRRRWYVGGRASVKSSFSQQRNWCYAIAHSALQYNLDIVCISFLHVMMDWKQSGLTFLFSSWISAWVTACLIWSYRQRQSKQGEKTTIKKGHPHEKRIPFRLQLIKVTYLLKFVGQLFRVQLHGRQHVLVFGQVENLNGVWKHWTHLFLFICRIFACLLVNRERFDSIYNT